MNPIFLVPLALSMPIFGKKLRLELKWHEFEILNLYLIKYHSYENLEIFWKKLCHFSSRRNFFFKKLACLESRAQEKICSYYKWEDPPLPLPHCLYLGQFYSIKGRFVQWSLYPNVYILFTKIALFSWFRKILPPFI